MLNHSRTVPYNEKYHQTSNIIRTLLSNTFAYHSDVVEATPVGTAPTTSQLHLLTLYWVIMQNKMQSKGMHIRVIFIFYE